MLMCQQQISISHEDSPAHFHSFVGTTEHLWSTGGQEIAKNRAKWRNLG